MCRFRSARLAVVALPGYGSGEVVRLKLFLRNVADGPLELEVARNIPEYDVVVRDPEGRGVWSCAGAQSVVRLSMNKMRTLAPGQTWLCTCEWDQARPGGGAVPRGEYEVSGLMTVNEKKLRSTSQRITLR